MASSSTIPATENKVLILKSSDGDEFQLEESIAIGSVTIKNMVEDDCASNTIPLPNVDTEALVKIIEYLKKHAEISGSDEEEEIKKTKIKDFDKEFVSVKMQKLFNIILAANFLDIKALLDLCAQAIADKIKNKSHVAVRKIFNVECDYTKEEEEAVRKENAWAFEGEEFDESLD
ncbi:SKP1-like protein 11 [Nicotiana tabacum]|uniref:SKP1-like protein n=1 Tax=Nicotiana tabacum TaxID=4097 RepID=A0A1S4BRQ7_TOBAC|nr:PREDICTED: SKP1-like protein 11 [Nicotiana tabacum]